MAKDHITTEDVRQAAKKLAKELDKRGLQQHFKEDVVNLYRNMHAVKPQVDVIADYWARLQITVCALSKADPKMGTIFHDYFLLTVKSFLKDEDKKEKTKSPVEDIH